MYETLLCLGKEKPIMLYNIYIITHKYTTNVLRNYTI